MIRYLLIMILLAFSKHAEATLAGGRPNAFSQGQNAFAGVINPANAVWIPDRLDIGAFWVNQKGSLNNHDNNPSLPPGKIDMTYRARNILTADMAIHKRFDGLRCLPDSQFSFSLASYTTPGVVKVRTKVPFPISGTTPIKVHNKTEVLSAVFSLKLNKTISVGISVDYLRFSHLRNGYQNADNFLRSVSPGHVTNRGTDHSNDVGLTVGFRWNITEKLHFGTAWSRKSYAGQYRKYRGFEPHHAHNYTPQLFGAGFNYIFTDRIAGRLEVLWTNLGNLPSANNNFLPNGSPNLNKRGSNKSPGPGQQDATYINMGMGCKINKMLSVGAGLSHRIKLRSKNKNIASHTYRLQTIYDILSVGANFNCGKHDIFMSFAYGFRNSVSGYLPEASGGGKLSGHKQNVSLSFSWGYLY